ncbi:MAG: sensor histidine kinase [Paludibacter sp.]
MKIKKSNNILLITLLSCFISGLICDFLYRQSPKYALHTVNFQTQLNKKEALAAKTLIQLQQIIVHSYVDSLAHFPFAGNDISYYVFENDELVFWSDNSLDITNISLPDSTDWHFVQLPNAQCVSRLLTFENIKILALITIKHNYPYQNNELINSFASGFYMDKEVQLVDGKESDQNAIFCSHGEYLFSLSEPQMPIYNEVWAIIGFIAFSFSFFIFFYLFAHYPKLFNKKSITLSTFILLATIVGVLIGICLYFNLPGLLFSNKIFTAFQYASNPLLASICHLTVATGYFISTIYLFYFYVNISKTTNFIGRLGLQIQYTVYFALVYYLIISLIYHSSIQLNILQFNDISIISIWVHFLILLWGISLALLFFKTHNWLKINKKLKLTFIVDLGLAILLYLIILLVSSENAVFISISFITVTSIFYLPFIIPKFKNIYGFIAIWTLAFTVIFVWNSMIISRNKQLDKFKILAQNISINGNSENDRMADILLEELDIQIENDSKINMLVANPDSFSMANDYINKTYLRGFWNKYDMRLNVAVIGTDLYLEYDKFINTIGTQIKQTHFYNVSANENNMSYLGKYFAGIKANDSIFFFMEFYPRRNFKSYSFPNLLISSMPDIQSQLNISIAKYEHQKLVYSSGNLEFAPTSSWIPSSKADFFAMVYKGHNHYILATSVKTYIVIAEDQQKNNLAYLLYFIYVFLIYFSFSSFVFWSYLLIRNRFNFRIGLTAKFQYTFIILLIISFILIFYVSVNFIQKKYQEQQISELENKKSYIQKELQDMYYWNQDLTKQNMQALNFDLQELSYTYHTDIHVYNNKGVLVGSSQPLIFNKNLISNRISTKPYFTRNANLNQYEHIGKLNYLTGYTDFYNGDFLQIGFIAVPQFFSQDEIQREIESFLAVIIHIYLIIIVLAILISLFIGKQLSAPLNMLESKLKQMRLGQRNEKIDYTLNDEIGQLVIQYNRTVDELEQSANLLAKSERESAWKSMARQVAHEINNPLTPMKLSIQQLQRTKKLNDNRFDDYFEKSTIMLIEQIDNLSRIAGTFSDFARMPEANFIRLDVAARLYSVVQLFANNFEKIQVDYTGAEKDVYLFADPEQMVQVFNNLLKNAIQAIPSERKGIIKINLQQQLNEVIISFSDNGVGIDSKAFDKLFTPNFTTKTTGTGLGLVICKNIIESTGGTISFSSKINKGSVFTITLPNELNLNSIGDTVAEV